MSNMQAPSKPVVQGTNVSITPVDGATTYKLYKLKYRCHCFILADGKELVTSNDEVFEAADNNE